jgi:ABC-2 type transport system ATP-binding protein
MLIVQNIVKSFEINRQRNVVLNGVDFELMPGKVTGFLGANGAGKSTLMKIILGFTKPDAGVVQFQGIPFADDFRKYVGYLPEKPYFYMNLSAREYLCYLGELAEVERSQIKQRIQYWSKRVNISYALDRKLSQFSKGMLQRIGLVSTLLHQPKMIILDEPLSGLDPLGRQEFKEIIRFINQEHGVSVFFSSHIIPDLEEVSDGIVLLKSGKAEHIGQNEILNQSLVSKRYIIHVKTFEKNSLTWCKSQIKVEEKYLSDQIEKLSRENKIISKVTLENNFEKMIHE